MKKVGEGGKEEEKHSWCFKIRKRVGESCLNELAL